ncbi:aminoacyl-histidine dipeptidase [Rodentibacter pneumotropicus]|uniref:Aminoacyl-histidine dipeptidase n=1 Tax=Rodentibacter pneumotropicus TaxID=758 RepID=A0A448MJ86_9PAST|nr:aminoacyl-histidine dipeptidase [Rodentibacter pneumotropicus]
MIHLLNALPNGVIRNSDVIKNVVESSLSIGVLKTEGDNVKGTILVRSLIESGKAYVTELLSSVATLAGAKTEFSAPYPGWKPVNDSAILNLTKKHYADVLGKAPEIKVIHAGLECGLLKEHYPHIDMVSLGPTIRNAHSPDEKVQISAVQTYWEVLVRVLGDVLIK